MSFASVLSFGSFAIPSSAHAQSEETASGTTSSLDTSAPSVTTTSTTERVLVLQVGGETSLASALGPSLREAVHAHSRALALTPLPTDGSCDDLDCAAGFLATGAADVAAFVEVFGHDGVCEGVQATILVLEGTRYVGTAEVGTAGVEEAMRVALAQAVARHHGEALPTLGVNGTPAGATIRLDGVTWGTVPHAEPVAPGPHVIEVRSRGHRSDRRDITLGGEDLTIDVALLPGEDGSSADATPFWITGVGALVLGVSALVVGIVGFTMGESCVDAACTQYERPDLGGNGVWIGTGSALTVVGAVMIGLAASSGGSNGDQARATLRLRF
ncbi:MAG: PEGA domain-containing protein [Deltaproteobacteria bacterium]|nr:PEGA domain-containing protein [Deltaproteobacteria bacterium]